jgi:hypothetical protein
MQQLLELPASESCRLMAYENARVVTGIVNNTYILVVSGTSPCLNLEVRLRPRIYIRRPEWWAIEVVGCLNGMCLTATRAYTETLEISSVWGTEGIEVIGASRAERFKKPAGVP